MTLDFSFIHCADLHLGSRFKGLTAGDSELGSRMSSAPMEAFSRLVDAALERKVAFIVISGDVYDDSCTLPTTRMEFADELKRAGIPVFICRGNHDHEQPWDSAIPYPDNVTEFGTMPSSVSPMPGVEVVGVSFEGDHEVRNLVSMMSGSPGRFTVGCVHCDVDSTGGLPYAPCTMSDFIGRDVDYWALGHIHVRGVLRENPHVVYPGNIQGRNPKESGDKGAYLVNVVDGRVAGMEFLKLNSVAWRNVEIDVEDMSTDELVEELMERTDPGDMVRLTLIGYGRFDRLMNAETNQFALMISKKAGCRVTSIESVQVPRVPEGDHLATSVAAASESLTEGGREAILSILTSNKMLQPYRAFFESMSDDELKSLVSRARAMVLDGMGVRG